MGGIVDFAGRAVLVTGAGRGIGRELALLLASRGARIVVCDNGVLLEGSGLDRGPAERTASEIADLGGTAVACTADLASADGPAVAVQACLDAFGGIHGIAHIASTSPPLTPPDAIADRDLELVAAVNGFAAMRLVRAAWPHMARERRGRIVLATSAGIYGALGNTAYAAAKAAYIGLTRCLALEGAEHGICANAILPAAYTRMTEKLSPPTYARWFASTMTPDKVAVAAAWLLSDACDVTGELLAVGGGRIARVALAEEDGVLDVPATIESVAGAMPAVMAGSNFSFPKNLSERSGRVSALFGFDGALDSRALAPGEAEPGATGESGTR